MTARNIAFGKSRRVVKRNRTHVFSGGNITNLNYINIWFQTIDDQFACRSCAFGGKNINFVKLQTVDACSANTVAEIIF